MLPPFWDYRREYDELRDEVLAAVDRVFKSGQLILGPEGVAFERAMAGYVGVSGGVGVNSGTDAIYIALAAAGVTAGDEVITVPNTAVPTVSAIQILGARPVLVDIRDEDFLMDVAQIEAAITPRTKAIIPVHLYGQCVDLDPLMAIATRHGLKVIEDCAQSQGALYKNRRCGSIGTASTFSFYPTKLLGGYGDGGMVLSDDEAVVRLARSLRFYGMEETYYAERHGYNSRLDEVHAAILALKLPRVDGWIGRRRHIASQYRRGFEGSGLRLPTENAYGRHVYHLFVVETPGDRDATLQRIDARGLKCGVQYRWPIHLMRGYEDLGYRAGQFPVAEKKAQRIFSLPIYPHLKDEEVDEVVAVVRAAI
ncbi:MAG: DegT/DnrJ/EryC1/StrS family aminotransferase [Bradyrhizobium sp.]|uniref:DegT/DnrJ/EryC1/StrS family aminotransferase n=1 Tax=Bradyrhizobium sp. TaxID=376 RepID=UPI00271ADC3B|nr:DegT/DnrJ/EryC1/StrS family aminotransferase [Bradyrhizobium sp.]MDO8401207.1 DegT/DnrJ/EryC1/StrS family aminotransferase [Bradyrhizobium sp.]